MNQTGNGIAGILGFGVGGVIFLNAQGNLWVMCMAFIAGYSIAAIGWAFVDYNFSDGSESTCNPRPLAQMIFIHLLFLLPVSGLAYLFFYLRPLLPEWMTHEGRRGSIELFIMLLLLIFMGFMESSLLLGARPSEDSPSSDASSSESDFILKL